METTTVFFVIFFTLNNSQQLYKTRSTHVKIHGFQTIEAVVKLSNIIGSKAVVQPY